MAKQPKEKTKKITPEMLGYSSNIMGGMEGMFDGQADDPNKHLKLLLETEGNIDGKTDLTQKQIVAIIKIVYMAYFIGERDKNNQIIPDPALMSIVEQFKKLRVSKDRKSRKEFIEGIQGSNQINRQEGMFNKLGSWFRG